MNRRTKHQYGALSGGLKFVLTILVLALLAGVGAVAYRGLIAKENSTGNDPVFVVESGPLTISVTESGTIRPRELLVLKSELEGTSTILFLIAEGSTVKKGDLLVELDSSKMEESMLDQQINVQNKEASFIGAREKFEVVKNQAQSDIDLAELKFEFAKQDLQKYIEGEYPQRLRELEAKITLAEQNLVRLEDKYKWSKVLFDEKYLSETELKGDELETTKAQLDVELAKTDLDLLRDFTHKRDLAQLDSDVNQAEMALERTARSAAADIVQAEADKRAKESEFERQQEKLAKLETQIKKTKIVAPMDGLVVYATSTKVSWRGSGEPLAEGQEVREREELIHLPTTSSYMVEVKIHESSLEKVSVGLPARITFDALPGKIFPGEVIKIAPLPDATSVYMNPDLKVYDTEVFIDGNGDDLRNGMSCEVEIIVAQYKNAVYVPIQAVTRVGEMPVVYVRDGGEWVQREVDLGLDNNRMAHIVSGLEVGESVLLAPPFTPATVTDTMFDDHVPGDGGARRRGQGGEPGMVRGRRGDSPNEGGRPGAGISQEKRAQIGKRIENMPPDQAKKAKKKFRELTEEEREELMKQGIEIRSGASPGGEGGGGGRGR